MRTKFSPLSARVLPSTASLQVMEQELLKCVHCGFCNATCPTYQIRGDELDGPRGRLYQIKNVLEGMPITKSLQTHLDRCLLCRACETTCPSGVIYSRVLDEGRALVDANLSRTLWAGAQRRMIATLSNRAWSGFLFGVGGLFRPFLPPLLKQKIPIKTATINIPASLPKSPSTPKPRRFILLQGCVQPSLAPSFNQATTRVLAALNIEMMTASTEKCCGALRFHVGEHRQALEEMAHNINLWSSMMADDNTIEGVVINASGCSASVKDYGRLFALHHHDEALQKKAQRIADSAFDLNEILTMPTTEAALIDILKNKKAPANTVVFQAPCTLQHALKKSGTVEGLLKRLFEANRIQQQASSDTIKPITLNPVAEGHLCCGSAGTYSVLQPDIANELRRRKLNNLMAGQPDIILTANIGCHSHLGVTAPVPIYHYIEFLDQWMRQDFRRP